MAKAGHWGLSLRRQCSRLMRRIVRITAKDGLYTAALQVWSAVTFDAENRLRQWVTLSQPLCSGCRCWVPLVQHRIALPGGSSACDFLWGEFAHSPRFLLPDGSKK